MAGFAKHIFVCENVRPAGHPRGCCAEKGSSELRRHFRDALTARGIQADVRANSAGCLDACAFGATVVVYPEGVWYGGVTAADVDEIVDAHIVNGVPVERLRIRDERSPGI